MSGFPYVSPEQLMKDRAEFARKGIARGRSVVALEYADGVLFAGENASRSLFKTSEIYDRIAYGAVGKYNEFEALRVSGIRLADVKGYKYSREDVTAKSLANQFAQALGGAFMESNKPFEVELLLASITDDPAATEIFHIVFDGSIVDVHDAVAVGGNADELSGHLKEAYSPGLARDEAIGAAVSALRSAADHEIATDAFEITGLDRTRGRRAFFRLSAEEIAAAAGN